jgi:thiol-disulfide isomerase/thioredoxin
MGMVLELQALILVEQGARSDAVYLLRRQLPTYADTPAADTIRSTLNLLSLHGQPAPVLDAGMTLGPRLNDQTRALAGPTLVFFWAHWCQECKAEGPMLEMLLNKYRERGLGVVAPTRRYGYVDGGRPAAPDKELRHILRVRDTFYKFLKRQPVPVTDSNHKSYGVSVVPVIVLIDRQGKVRLYHPGRIGIADLEAAIIEVLER